MAKNLIKIHLCRCKNVKYQLRAFHHLEKPFRKEKEWKAQGKMVPNTSSAFSETHKNYNKDYVLFFET